MHLWKFCLLGLFTFTTVFADHVYEDFENGVSGWYFYDDNADEGDSRIESHYGLDPDGTYFMTEAFTPGYNSENCGILDYYLGTELNCWVGIGHETDDTLDLRGTTHFQFDAKADKNTPISFRAKISTVTDYDYHQTKIDITDEWQTFTIAIDDFEQQNWSGNGTIPFDLSQFIGFEFGLDGFNNTMGTNGQIYLDNFVIKGDPAQYRPPEPPEMVSPSNEQHWVSIEPDFIWNKQNSAHFYNIQLSSFEDFSVLIVDENCTDTVYSVDDPLSTATTYYWRVRGENDYGTGEWGAYHSFTTTSEPGQPQLLSPDDADFVTSVTPLLQWDDVDGAETYTVKIAEDDSFTAVLETETTNQSSYTVKSALENSSTYYWRVQAHNSVGDSEYSSIWSFSTPVLPSPPDLLSPINAATGVMRPVEFRWDEASDAETYTLQYSTSDDFAMAETVTDIANTDTSLASFEYSTDYYWRVRGENANGSGSWSSPQSFTTQIAPPPISVLLSPENGAKDILFPTTLIWEDLQTAEGYTVELSTSFDFSKLVLEEDVQSGNSLIISELEPNTSYYWRVRGYNAGGPANKWALRVFTTAGYPDAPELTSPADQETAASLRPELQWEELQTAASYKIEISTEEDFSNTIVSENVPVANFSLNDYEGDISNSTTYYWRVSAVNNVGESDFSEIRSFITPAPPEAPLLVSPTDNSTDISAKASLKWNKVGESYYQIEIRTQDRTIETTVHDTMLSYNFDYNSSVYWKVRTVNQNGTSAWSEEWEFTTEGAPPASPRITFPENEEEGLPVNLTLQWEATEEATGYHVQVCGNNSYTTIVVEDSTAATEYSISALDTSKTYFWRVRAYHTSAGPWSESDFRTAGLPVAPILISPANEAPVENLNPTLKWASLIGATSYTVEIATDTLFKQTLSSKSVEATSWTTNDLLSNTTYFWRVSASNSIGDGQFSRFRSFTTPSTLGKPVLAAPENGSTVPITIELEWEAVAEATSYCLKIASDNTMTTYIVDECGLASTSYSLSELDYGTSYYWQVKAANTTDSSDWTVARSFTTIPAPPAAPILSVPQDEAEVPSLTPSVSWDVVPSALSYTVEVCTSETFSENVISREVSVNEIALAELVNGRTYYWRVFAENNTGTSEPSTVWSFKTAVLPPAPALAFPGDDSTGIAIPAVLSWDEISDAASYQIQVSADQDFTNIIVDSAEMEMTTLETDVLDYSTEYFWRVRVMNAVGNGSWSEAYSFTTQIAPPDAPALVGPSNQAEGIEVDCRFIWKQVSDAENYSLQISESEDFSDTVVNIDAITDSFTIVTQLQNNTEYYWRVSAHNESGMGEWSSVWSFVTIIPAPETPMLITTGIDTLKVASFTSKWNKSGPEVTKYEIQVANDSLMKDTLFTHKALTDTVFEVTELENETVYWWRVRAYNDAGWGEFSDPAKIVVNRPIVPVIPADFSVTLSGAALQRGKVKYGIPEKCRVRMVAYDIRGRVVRTYLSKVHSPGNYSVFVDPNSLSAGKYFIIFSAGKYRRTMSLIAH